MPGNLILKCLIIIKKQQPVILRQQHKHSPCLFNNFPQDFNFNLLQYPLWQRMDLLPQEFKQKVTERYNDHMKWLRSQDHLTRATKGFESALDWMNKKDMSKHMPTFINETRKYDKIRNENFTDVFPEWKELFAKYEEN